MNDTALIFLPRGEPDWPFGDVAGLPLLERNLMGLRQAGAACVHLVCHPTLFPAVQDHLAARQGDGRLPEIWIHDGASGHLPDLPAWVVVLDGRRTFHPAALRAALAHHGEMAFGGAGLGVVSRGRAAENWTGQPSGDEDLEVFEGLESRELPAGSYAVSADNAESRRAARRLVFRSLIKPTDGWFSVNLNRPVSLGISRILVRLPVHPNLATAVTFLVGMASGLFPAQGSYLGFALGGLLYQLASILDGVDGEISRVKFLGSRLGQWLDTIGDDLTNVAYLAGVTVGVYRSTGTAWLVWVGGLAIGLFVLSHAVMYWMLAVRFDSGDMFGFEYSYKKSESRRRLISRVLIRLEPFVRRDCYAFSFMVLALAGVAWVALPVSLIGIGATAVVVVGQLIGGRKSKAGVAAPGESPR